MPKRPHAGIAICVVLLALAAPSAQNQPTFRAGVQYTEVDVFVTDQDGNPVRGLSKDDFTLLEDDRAQEIASFTYVDLPIESPAARAVAASVVQSDVTTNVGEGRMYVMLVNGAGERAAQFARRFVEEAVGPRDQVAVIHILGNMSAAQAFTTNRRLMLDAIDRIDRAPPPPLPGDSRYLTFVVAEELFKTMGQVTGRRKAVLWFDPPALFVATGDNAHAFYAQRDAIRAASRNNVALYVIDTSGLTTELGLGELERQAGQRVLADDTGGGVIAGTNNMSPAFQQFVRDNSSYYLLGYVTPVEGRDGRFHPLTVRVKRPGVVVRARRGYPAPDADGEIKAARRAAASPLSAETRQSIRLPMSPGDLGIDLFATPFKGSGRTASVLIGAQLRGSGLRLDSGEKIEVAHQATNTEGKFTRGRLHVVTLDLTAESRRNVERNGVRILQRIELPRGRHQVRFAAHQPNGKTGMVIADVEVPDYGKDPPTVSGIVLASALANADFTMLGDARLKALLGGEPAVRRRFSRADTVTAFIEVYTDARKAQEGAQVTAALTTGDGARLLTQPGSLVASVPGTAGYAARLPLADVPPGQYILTMEVRDRRRAAMRQIPIAVADDSSPGL